MVESKRRRRLRVSTLITSSAMKTTTHPSSTRLDHVACCPVIKLMLASDGELITCDGMVRGGGGWALGLGRGGSG